MTMTQTLQKPAQLPMPVLHDVAWCGSTLIPRIAGTRVTMHASYHDARHGIHAVCETHVCSLSDQQLWIARMNTWELGSFDIQLPANNATTEILTAWLEKHPDVLNECVGMDPEDLQRRLQPPGESCPEWWDAHAFLRGPIESQPRVQWNCVHQFISDCCE